MASLGIELAKLTNPTPKILDSEDEENLDLSMKNSNDENADAYETSELRSRTAHLLEDIDTSYTGRKVSRKSRGLIFDKVEDNVPQSDEEESESSEDNLSDLDSRISGANDSSDEQDEDISDENISTFKNNLQNKSNSDFEDNEEGSSNDSDDEETGKDDMISQFADIDVSSEIEKGKAIKAQQEIWNRLCEGRIKLQKLLLISNKLPQTDCYAQIKHEADKEMSDLISKGSDSMKNLLNTLINLHAELCKKSTKEVEGSLNDEEILSSDDALVNEGEEKNEINREKSVKRKCKNDDYSEILSKHFKSEKSNRNAIIQKWDEKVRLSTGRMTQKSFNAFDNSAVKQIEQILQDKNRLIKRTQLKRSVYRVLGKPEFLEDKKDETSNHKNFASKQDMLLKDYDPQIFDDEDFYRQLLNDIIQGKYFGIDPSIVRKQMELQKIRNKMKRKVDTKASKGRRLRYDVFPQLVNFMAPVKTSTISDEARENMLKCLFGKALVQTEDNNIK